jgi:hypothetical protein
MTKPASALLFSLACAVLLACGGPQPGKSCNRTGYYCMDKDSAAECRDGVWVELPCRGPGGCASSGGNISCDMSANLPGDACAASQEGHGLCSATKTAIYECRDGTLVQTQECRACSISNNQVTCQP